MIPAIGKPVWFYPSDASIKAQNMKVLDRKVPMPATICFCDGDSQTVNIVGFDHLAYWVYALNVQVFKHDEVPEAVDEDYCVWIPGTEPGSFYATS